MAGRTSPMRCYVEPQMPVLLNGKFKRAGRRSAVDGDERCATGSAQLRLRLRCAYAALAPPFPEFEGAMGQHVPATVAGYHRPALPAQFCSEQRAADGETRGWIAECGGTFRGEAVLARRLSHHLHGPRKSTRLFFP